MEVIKAWVSQEYSLRYVVVDVPLAYIRDGEHEKLDSIVETLRDLISSLDKKSNVQTSETNLSISFLDAVKQSVRDRVMTDCKSSLD